MKHIWIINNNSSTTVFYKNYGEMKIDPDMLSGLLTALNNFSAVELQSTGISSIEMGGLRWVYSQQSEMNLMLIGADEKSANSETMRSRLEVIFKMFVAQFELTPEKMNKELINVKEFLPFGQTLDMLKSQWLTAESQFGPAQLFDLLGIFQQIFTATTDIVRFNFYGDNYNTIINQFQKLASDLKEDEKIKNSPEIAKIDFDGTQWNCINLNPMLVDGNILRSVLFSVLSNMKEILMEHMSKMSMLFAFNKYVYPFIINQYEMLNSLKILQPILNIFLRN